MSVWKNPSKYNLFLRGIWEDKTNEAIAAGLGVTPNAVIGYLYRHRDKVRRQLAARFRCTPEYAKEKLENRKKQIVGGTSRPAARAQREASGFSDTRADEAGKLMIFPPRGPHRCNHDLSEDECPWPIGHPGDKDFRFCRASKPKRKIYCDEHESQARGGKPKPKLSEDVHAHL